VQTLFRIRDDAALEAFYIEARSTLNTADVSIDGTRYRLASDGLESSCALVGMRARTVEKCFSIGLFNVYVYVRLSSRLCTVHPPRVSGIVVSYVNPKRHLMHARFSSSV
jgi:hypothetical protein